MDIQLSLRARWVSSPRSHEPASPSSDRNQLGGMIPLSSGNMRGHKEGRTKMTKCPHCLQTFHEIWNDHYLGRGTTDKENPYARKTWVIRKCDCTECGRTIMSLRTYDGSLSESEFRDGLAATVTDDQFVVPKSMPRKPLPREIPDEFAEDYREASLVLADSPKASAALSRRCLQHFLQEKMGAKSSELAAQIEHVLTTGGLPSHLAEAIDAVRRVGNFAAHPIKSKHTGEVIDVEPGEAEWLLDTLESLFDFYFIQPIELQKRRDALDRKLKEAGKPPLK